jgi:hypothetical protein
MVAARRGREQTPVKELRTHIVSTGFKDEINMIRRIIL